MAETTQVTVGQAQVRVVPGQPCEVQLKVHHGWNSPGHYALTIEGDQPAWVELDPKAISCFPLETQTATIRISAPGGTPDQTFSLTVCAKSQLDPRIRGEAPLQLTVSGLTTAASPPLSAAATPAPQREQRPPQALPASPQPMIDSSIVVSRSQGSQPGQWELTVESRDERVRTLSFRIPSQRPAWVIVSPPELRVDKTTPAKATVTVLPGTDDTATTDYCFNLRTFAHDTVGVGTDVELKDALRRSTLPGMPSVPQPKDWSLSISAISVNLVPGATGEVEPANRQSRQQRDKRWPDCAWAADRVVSVFAEAVSHPAATCCGPR